MTKSLRTPFPINRVTSFAVVASKSSTVIRSSLIVCAFPLQNVTSHIEDQLGNHYSHIDERHVPEPVHRKSKRYLPNIRDKAGQSQVTQGPNGIIEWCIVAKDTYVQGILY